MEFMDRRTLDQICQKSTTDLIVGSLFFFVGAPTIALLDAILYGTGIVGGKSWPFYLIFAASLGLGAFGGFTIVGAIRGVISVVRRLIARLDL